MRDENLTSLKFHERFSRLSLYISGNQLGPRRKKVDNLSDLCWSINEVDTQINISSSEGEREARTWFI